MFYSQTAIRFREFRVVRWVRSGRGIYMKRCPCCGCLTMDDSDEMITDICDVCFWQYDEMAQNMPNRIIGANKVSLNAAKKNYKLFGAVEERFMNMVRAPYEDEI